MSQDRKQKLQLGVSLCGSCLFYVPHCCYSSYGLVFLRIHFFFASKYQITCLRSYYSPFHFSGWFSFPLHPLTPLPKKEEVTFFQIKRSKGTGDTAGPWTLALNHVWKRILHERRLRWILLQEGWPFNTLERGTVQEDVGTGGQQFKWMI